jgi:hypothetical protein
MSNLMAGFTLPENPTGFSGEWAIKGTKLKKSLKRTAEPGIYSILSHLMKSAQEFEPWW